MKNDLQYNAGRRSEASQKAVTIIKSRMGMASIGRRFKGHRKGGGWIW